VNTHIAYFLIACLVACIGAQALGEAREPMGVVPRQVLRPRGAHVLWGKVLVACGSVAVAIGLLGLAEQDLEPVLVGGQVVCLLLLAAYGLWVVVGSGKVVYEDAPSADPHAH